MKLTKQQEAKNRNKEQFYTSVDCVNYVMDSALKFLNQNNINISNKNVFIESAAGEGVFVNWLKQNKFKNIQAYDLEPKAEGIIQKDIHDLLIEYNQLNISIGNPPFAYKGELALYFLNKSLEFGDVVIFILPIQFNRWGIQKKIKENAKLIYSSKPLPKKSFIYKNKPYSVNCIFQIWVNDRPKFKNIPDLRIRVKPASKHPDFKAFIYNNTKTALKFFDKDLYKWDFAVVRQGYYDYTKKITNPNDLKPNRQYIFIKYLCPRAKEVFKHIDFKELAESNTSIKGFSNTDLVAKYNEVIDKLHL